MRIVITDTAEPLNRDLEFEKKILFKLLGNDSDIEVYTYNGDREELITKISDADAILTSYLQFDAELLKKCHHLKVISIEATGYNNIDINTANQLGIRVCVIEEYCTEEVSDFVILGALSMNKQLKYYVSRSDTQKSYDFQPNKPILRLSDSTFGIMGLGKIGSEVARKARAFGMKVITYSTSRAKNRAKQMNIPFVSKKELFQKSDFIALTMKLTKENINILNRAAFQQMRKMPVIINIARGVMIDEEALFDSLNEGKVRGAVLDVLVEESAEGLKNSPLVGRNDVMITPHVAFYSDQSLEDCQRIATENLAYGLLNNNDKLFRTVN